MVIYENILYEIIHKEKTKISHLKNLRGGFHSRGVLWRRDTHKGILGHHCITAAEGHNLKLLYMNTC